MSLETRFETPVEVARAEEAPADADVAVVFDADCFGEWAGPAGRPEHANRCDFETFIGGTGI